MTVISRSEDKIIRINIVEIGKDKRYVEVPEGSTGAALLDALGGSGRRVTAGGIEVQRDTPLRDEMTACVGPKSVKQG